MAQKTHETSFHKFLKNKSMSTPLIMLIFSILASIKAYYMTSPRHTLVISTRTSPFRLDSFPFPQVGPYKTSSEPLLFARTFRPSTESNSDRDRKDDNEKENKEGIKKKLSSVFFTSGMFKFFFYTVVLVLIFTAGYQTRKCHEGNSYVRLPTNN